MHLQKKTWESTYIIKKRGREEMEKINNTLREMIEDNIKYTVRKLAMIDQLVKGIEDYDKLNEIDNLTYLEINKTLNKIFEIIQKED